VTFSLSVTAQSHRSLAFRTHNVFDVGSLVATNFNNASSAYVSTQITNYCDAMLSTAADAPGKSKRAAEEMTSW
jgi:hypothetical protein